MPYPPGTGPNDPNAPWNDPPAPECDYCQNIIHEEEDHAPDCDYSGVDSGELRHQQEEDAKYAQAEAQMDQQRIDEQL